MCIASFVVSIAPPNICDCFEMWLSRQRARKLAINVVCFLLMDVCLVVSLLETARKIDTPSLAIRFRDQETWNKENLQPTLIG
jgi:hypothetical protein